MKVFLSWSGERSRLIALALREWLPTVLQHVKVWMSDHDIPAGQRWASEIARELEASKYGIICITPENTSAPWLLFESGAIAKSLSESAVCPLLFDIDHSGLATSPLSQFQAKKVGRNAFREILAAMNTASGTPLDADVLDRAFEALWPHLEARLKEVPSAPAIGAPKANLPSQSEVLDNLVESVRGLTHRFDQFERMLPRQDSIGVFRDYVGWDARAVMPVEEARSYARAFLQYHTIEELASETGISLEEVKSFLQGERPLLVDAVSWTDWFRSRTSLAPNQSRLTGFENPDRR